MCYAMRLCRQRYVTGAKTSDARPRLGSGGRAEDETLVRLLSTRKNGAAPAQRIEKL